MSMKDSGVPSAAQDKNLPRQTAFASVRNRRVPELVAEQIRGAILSGVLKPGERLVEQKLSLQFGIGQPTLREALQELERHGFVRKNGNRGTFVTQFSEEDMRKNLEVRVVLEALAVQRAAKHVSDEDVNELQQIIGSMCDCAARFDRPGFHHADVSFHSKIWRLADNAYLSAALERFTFGLFAFALVRRNPLDGVFRNVVEQHQLILDGLKTRDPIRARKAYESCTLDFWRE